jgi:ATP-binding cassette subfamily B protein
MLHEFRTLLAYVRKYKWHYILGVLCLLVTSGGQIVIPQFIRVAIDTIVAGDFLLTTVGRYMLYLIGVALLIAIARFGWRFFLHGASRRIEMELRGRLFNHLMTLSANFFRRRTTGDLMARSTNDMQAIRMAAGMALVAMVDAVFMSIAILAILFTRTPRLAALVIIPLPLVTVAILFVGKLISERFRKVQEGFSILSERAQESITGIRVIKAFVKERYFLDRFADANENYRIQNLRYIRIWGMFFPVITFLSGVTTLLLLRFGGEMVILGTVTPGEFVATMSYLQMLIWPMLGAGLMVNWMARGAASLGRINAILNTKPDIASPPGAVTDRPRHDISVRNLTFRYASGEEEEEDHEDDVPVLRNVSLEIPQGTIVGILGRTGSGKSTLVSILPRILDPPPGTVYLGGVDVHEYDLETLRSAFAIVPQDTFLFSATVEENIAFGVPHADPQEIRRVADISTISRDVADFPEGWKTPVGERGVTLSGGQKQRVAISRALLRNPDILIFDDALSAVDTESESRILSELFDYRAGKSSVIISHRVSTLQNTDVVYVIDDGTIAQSGTHQELVGRAGLYRDIYRLQQSEHEAHQESHHHG